MLPLNNGVMMPQLGLGVWQAGPDETADAVETAIAAGYRLVDTASAYGNEEGVGRGIVRSGIDRAEMFVITKLALRDFAYDRALRAFDESLHRLGLDYVDLYLLHWPVPREGDAAFTAYRALERIHAAGRTRAIGVCNYPPDLLTCLLDRVSVVPALNQVELHPYFVQEATRRANTGHGIVTQSWSPIGGSSGSGGGPGMGTGRRLLAEPALLDLGRRYGKTPAQVVLRWHVQHGLAVIPKSADPRRIAANIDIFDFELTPADMRAIDGLDTGVRGAHDPYEVDFHTWTTR
jgi:diketogulonate reductase-like aldo/keto reductase